MQKLTKEERIALRSELFQEFINNKFIYYMNNKNCYAYRNFKYFKMQITQNNKLFDKYDLYIQQFKSEKEAAWCILHQDDFENHICPICNKNICKFYEKEHKYRKTCSRICSEKISNSKEAKEAAKKTWLQNLGVDHPSKSDKIKEAKEQTCMDHFGCKCSFQAESVKETSKQTKLKRYNDENYTNRERYKKTCEERYGKLNTFQVKEFIEAAKQTKLEKSEFKNIIIDEDILKIIDQIKEKFLVNDIDTAQIYYNNDYYSSFIKFLYAQKKRKLRLIEISNIFERSTKRVKDRMEFLNLSEYFYIKDSDLEMQLKELLENNNINFERANRNILPKTEKDGSPELDFYLKDYNIAIEVNDIDSHNVIKQPDQYYHINKTIQCKERNIRLIHLWEWELADEDLWLHTSNWILNLLNNSKIQINSKDCIIKEIDKETAQNFINEYNLYDYVESDVNLGLYHNNELLQIVIFKREKNNSYELLQFCTKFNYNIKDGTQSLLNYFIQQYNPQSIAVVVNLDKFAGETFEEIGFQLVTYNKPKLISYNNTSSLYKSIYNCGQNVYVLELR